MATLEQLYGHLKSLNKQWFYDKEEIDELLDDKLDEVEVPSKTSDLTNDGDGTYDFITKSDTAGLVKNDGTIDTNTYLTSHQDISGKANISDLHAIATSGSFTDLENIPATFAPTAHEHSASDVKDSSAYANLGTSANATQSAINYAVDVKIGSLLSVEYQTIVQTLPTASADTMNKFYLVAESTAETNDEYEIFITVKDGNNYSWEKVDTARLNLSGYSTTSHVHGNITSDGAIGSASGKILVTGTNGVITTSDTITELDGTIQSLISYGENLGD